jgi:hypothetical protein
MIAVSLFVPIEMNDASKSETQQPLQPDDQYYEGWKTWMEQTYPLLTVQQISDFVEVHKRFDRTRLP